MHNIILKKLGLNIRSFRQQLGLSQEKLSFRCDLDRTYIGSVERGERNISIINLCKIAKALQTTPEAIVKGIIVRNEENDET